MDSWLVFCRNRVIFNHWTKLDIWPFERFSKASFIWGFPIRQEILNVHQIGNSTPYNQPTIFHPSLIATVQQTFLLLLCVLLFRQSRSSRIDDVSKFDDSMVSLHRICQIPMNCQCKWLSAVLTARDTFVNSFPSPEKFLFYTDKIDSIEWQDLVWGSVSAR